jgi:hypothetical protein
MVPAALAEFVAAVLGRTQALGARLPRLVLAGFVGVVVPLAIRLPHKEFLPAAAVLAAAVVLTLMSLPFYPVWF